MKDILLILSFLLTSCRSHVPFSHNGENSASIHPPIHEAVIGSFPIENSLIAGTNDIAWNYGSTILNPFSLFSSNEIAQVIVMGYREPEAIITVSDTEVISRLYRYALMSEFKYSWITLAGGGPLAYLHFMDVNNNRIALVNVNSYHCEYAVLEAREMEKHGVSYSYDFVKLVYDLMKNDNYAIWMTPEFEKKLLSKK